MRHVNVKLDDADWRAFEALRATLERRRHRSLTLSSLLRLVIRAGIEAQGAVAQKADAAPIAAPAEPGERWEKHIAKKAKDAAQLRQERKALHRRFEHRCDQKNLTPHEFIEQMTQLDPGLRAEPLHAWYFEGKLPAESGDANRILEAVHRWLGGAKVRLDNVA